VPSGYVVPSDASVFFQPPKLQSQKAEKIYLIKNVLHLYFFPSHTVSTAPSGTALGINRAAIVTLNFGTALADRRRPETPISPGSILARRREAKPAARVQSPALASPVPPAMGPAYWIPHSAGDPY
jgi:hypothetical protein